jgi:hypothetical protein
LLMERRTKLGPWHSMSTQSVLLLAGSGSISAPRCRIINPRRAVPRGKEPPLICRSDFVSTGPVRRRNPGPGPRYFLLPRGS